MSIESIIEGVIGKEGAYSNNPADRGGETMWGVTAAVARANGYTGAMRSMPRATAVAIYRKRYVTEPGFDKLATVNGAVAEAIIDAGVNMGPVVAGQFLQRALNVLNQGGRDFADLVRDGDCGEATRAALASFLAKRGAEGLTRLLRLIRGLRAARYVELCEARPANETFMFGWLDRVA